MAKAIELSKLTVRWMREANRIYALANQHIDQEKRRSLNYAAGGIAQCAKELEASLAQEQRAKLA